MADKQAQVTQRLVPLTSAEMRYIYRSLSLNTGDLAESIKYKLEIRLGIRWADGSLREGANGV